MVILGGNHDSGVRVYLPASLLGERLQGNKRFHFVGALPRCDGAPDFARLLPSLRAPSGNFAA